MTVPALEKKNCDSKRRCSVTPRHLDTSLPLEANVLVLRTILVFHRPSDLSTRPYLRLADVNLFKPRSVDLLLGAHFNSKILLDVCRPILYQSSPDQKTVSGCLGIGLVPAAQVRTFAITIDLVFIVRV